MASHPSQRTNTRSHQTGAVALVAAVLLLFSASIAVLYLNRSLIFEQRTSSNQVKSTQALQMAEAGLEWATAMLNSSYSLVTNNVDGSDCSLDTSSSTNSFNKRYVQSNPSSTSVVSATTTFAGCKVNGTSMTCNCPTVTVGSTTAASLGTSTLPGFTVAFSDVSGDTESVRVTATGCTALDTACYSSTKANADASASVSAILKLLPTLKTAPSAPLTCATCNLSVSGTTNTLVLNNTDLATNGMLIHAGTAVTAAAAMARMTTIAGLSPDSAVAGSDGTLSSTIDSTCSNSYFLSQFVGKTISEYSSLSQVKTINCSSSDTATCTSETNTAYSSGWRSFYFPTGFFWYPTAGSTLGSESDPVVIVAGGSAAPTIAVSATSASIYGLVFNNFSNQDGTTASGNISIQGALVACASYRPRGQTLTVTYNPTVLKAIRRSTGSFVRVPGSWKDF